MQTRKVIINQSAGQPMQEVETTAQTWGELQRELTTANISFSGMKAIIGETRTTMESNNSRLPLEGIFNLYLLPRKTKSGASSTKKTTEMSKVKPETKSEIAAAKAAAKKAPVKKAVVKKAIVKKVEPTEIKPKVVAIKKSTSSLQAAAQLAIAETKKEMNEAEIVHSAINILRTVKNASVQVLLSTCISDLDNISYIIATGKPRIDNLQSKKTACELMQDGNLGLQNNC